MAAASVTRAAPPVALIPPLRVAVERFLGGEIGGSRGVRERRGDELVADVGE